MKTLLSTLLLAFSFTALAQTGEFMSIPNATVKDINGKSIQTGDLNNDGKPMIISMWATWCKPCIRELNAIKDVYPDWQEETGVKLVAISIDDARSAAKVRPFVNGEGWEYEFDHIGVKDGSSFMVGNLKIDVLHTPGHTPESISFLLTDTPASPEPVMFFTGDFVFVGDIGRPDLLEKAAGMSGTMDAGAHEMYKSIKRFSDLPDYIQVWPGHGAGSACGKALGAVPSTTVGYEKVRNWAFRFANDENGFVKFLLEDQPEPPK